MESQADPSICPACGEPNVCGLMQGKSECWCFSTTVSEAALRRVPSEAKDKRCLCARCAAVTSPRTIP